MRLKKYFFKYELFSFALGLWLCFLLLRLFEFVGSVNAGNITPYLVSFIAGFWNDLGIIVLLTLGMSLISFFIAFFSSRVSDVILGVFGGIVVLLNALLTFFAIEKGELLSRQNDGLESNWLTTLGETFAFLTQLPNLMLLFLTLGLFAVVYYRVRGANNAKFLSTAVVLLFIQGFIPPVRSWFQLSPEMKVLASNKTQYFLEKRYAGIDFKMDSKSNEFEGQTANLSPNIQEVAILEPESEKTYAHFTNKEKAYLEEESLASLSSATLYEHAKLNAFKRNFFEAETLVKLLTSRDSKNIDFQLLKGHIMSWQQQFDAAEAHFKGMLDLAPDYDEIYLAIADIHYWKGDKTKAISILDSGLTYVSNPDRIYVKKEQIRLAR